jgi:hypothetical protein
MPFAAVVFGLITAVLLGSAAILAVRQGRLPPRWALPLGAAYLLLLGTLFYLDPVEDLKAHWMLLGGVVVLFVLLAGWAITTRWRKRPRLDG